MSGGPDPGPVAGYLTEPLAEPELDRDWTSDRELDRLRPLTESLRDWAEVYERWRAHPLAGARPAQPGFEPADRAALDALRGVHFGALTAAAGRWQALAVAADRWAEACRVSRRALAEAWQDESASAALLALDRIQRLAEDCAAGCAQLGLHLDVAIGETAMPVVRDAVAETLARARGFGQAGAASELSASRSWGWRITELDTARREHPAAAPTAEHRRWCAELDGLVTDYDAVIGLLRANLSAAGDALAEIRQTAQHGLAAAPAAVGQPGEGQPGEGPSGTVPASADVGVAGSSSGASSGATAGGGGAPGTDAPPGGGPLVLGEGDGSARLASVAGDVELLGTECAADAASASSQAATAGAGAAAGGTGSGEQHRTGRPRPGQR